MFPDTEPETLCCLQCGHRFAAVALVPLDIPEARTTWHKPLKAKP